MWGVQVKRKPVKFAPHDVAVCADYRCPSRDHCLRFGTDKLDKWQTYANFERKPDEKQCKHFMGEVMP